MKTLFTKVTGITKVVSDRLGEFDIFHTTTKGIPMDFIPAYQVDEMLIDQAKRFNKSTAVGIVTTVAVLAAVSFVAYKCGEVMSKEKDNDY